MNKLSKLTALLLALIMMLSAPLTAWAESIDTETKYEAQVSEILAELYAAMMAGTTFEELLTAASTMTRTEIENYLARLLADKVDDDLAEYDAHIAELFEAYMANSTFVPAVNYTNVGPFLAPVTAASTFSLQSRADSSGSEGISLNKTVDWNQETSTGNITIEAFATGEKVTTVTTTTVPTDIVLVLDLSGSMSASTSGGYYYGSLYTKVSSVDTSKTYFVKLQNGTYTTVSYCTTCQEWTHGCNHLGTEDIIGTKYSPNDNTFYTSEKRLDALRAAVEGFVYAVYKKAAGADGVVGNGNNDNIAHRISVITFNEDADMFINGSESTDYGNGLVDVSSTAGQKSVSASVAKAMTNQKSGTRTDLGIAEANKVLDANPIKSGETRNRVVIVFTDGTPDSSSGYNTPISYANTSKNTHDATVYTIGVIDGANPDASISNTSNSNINKFLHYISSNFPNAQSMSNGGSGSIGSGYYLSASSADALNDIFQKIAQNIENGGSTTELTESAVINDVLTSTFQLPNGYSSIRIYTADVNDATGTTPTFKERVQVYPTTDGSTATITPVINGQSISVTGFDFADKWVGTETKNGSTTTRAGGQKLIIEIDIEPVDGYLGGNVIETNESTSGIYENEQAESPVVPLPDPKDVNVKPLTIKPKVITQDLNIYLTNNVNVVDVVLNLGYFWDDVDGDGNLDWTDTDQDGVFDPSEDTATDEIYTVDGIRNKDADLVYTIKDGDTTLATFTIPAGTTYAGVSSIKWKDPSGAETTLPKTLLDDKTYTVTCEVIQTTTGTPENGGFGSTIDSDTATINVFKPVLTFQDSTVDYLSTLTLPDYFGNNNHVASALDWAHKGTSDDDASMYNGAQAPDVTLNYSYAAEDIDGNGKVISTDDIPVNVTVSIGGNDYTAHCKFNHQNCSVTGCTWATVGSTNGSPEFLLHVANVWGNLAIAKNVDGTGASTTQTFTFEVQLTAPSGVTLGSSYSYTVNGGATQTLALTAGKGTITLTDGQTATITGIPAGTTYTVTEAAEPGYTSSSTITQTVTGGANTIDGNGLDTVTFTNTYNPGTLTITKNVTKAEGITLPAGTVFTFTVTLKDGTTPLSGTHNFAYTVTDTAGKTVTNETATFTNGEATITLADGQTATFATLPDGVNYTVAENAVQGFVLDTDAKKTYGLSGTIDKAKASSAVFTNIHQYGNLVISKTVNGTPNGYTPDEFTFTVTLSDKANNVTYGDVTFANGIATFTLKGGESKTITDLPAGTTYTIEEAAVPGYTTTATGESGTGTVVTGTIDAAGIDTVAYTNEYKVGGLTVTKNVTGDTAPNDGTGNFIDVFTFTLALTSNNAPVLAKGVTCTIAGQATNVTWTDGKYTFKLTDGQIATFANLPDGVTYTVVEVVDDVSKHYTSTPTNATGSIKAGATMAEEFVNDYKYGELTISKNVVNAPEGDTNRAFQFTVTLDQTAGVKYITSNDSTEKNFTGSIALKNGESVTFKYIPDGAAYTVKETLVAGYATTVTGGDIIANDLTVSGAIENGVKDTIAFTNTYSVGNLSIEKKVEGATAPSNDTFAFTVKLTAPTNGVLATSYAITGGNTPTYTRNTDTTGTLTFTLKKDEVLTVNGLQTGVVYTVEETVDPDYTTTMTVNNVAASTTTADKLIVGGSIKAQSTESVIFTNTYTKGDLKITKTVNGDGADLQKAFTFTVTIGASGTFNVVDENGNPKDSIASGGTIQLKNGETAIIKDIPHGTDCTVEETPVAGYATTANDRTSLIGSATIEQGTTVTIPFTNTYSVADLTITKVVTPADSKYASPDDEFTITVTLTAGENAMLAETYSITGLDAGKCAYDSDTGIVTLTMKKGQSAIIKGLQIGTGYEVVEANKPDYYKVSYNNKEGTISTTNAVTVTNEYQYGGLMITKKVDAAEGVTVPSQDFTFTVTLAGLTDPSFEATVEGLSTSTLTFTNGVATFPLQAEETATFLNLPVGVKYTVAEAVNNDYTTTATINGESVALTTANNLHQMETAGSIVENTSQNVVFTNTYQYSDLKISKTVVNASTLYPDDDLTAVPFTFTVTLNSEGSYTYVVTDTATGEAIKDESGSAITGSIANNGTLTLASSQTATIKNIPVGTSYTVSEKAVPEFVTTVVGNTSGTISATEVPEVAFTNTYSVGRLTVTKTVVDKSGMGYDLSNDVFTFTVNFSDTVNAYTYTKSDNTTGTIMGTGPITLKHDETAIFDRIPAGVTYTVTEGDMPYAGYTVSANPITGQIAANASSTAAFTNTYNTGSLTIHKTGMTGNETAVFTVTGSVHGEPISIKVVVPNDGYTTVNGLDIGGEYTVSELETWTWRYTSSGPKNVTIPKTGTYNASVTYENTEKHNYWLDGSAYADNAFGDMTTDNTGN